MGRTVLIVEDDKSVARLLADVLESEGYQALVEGDGEWALRTFQHKDVDLVITDVLLPKLVGTELVEQLRGLEKGKNTPIIMLSGVYRAAQHQQKMIDRFGVRAYFDKPVDLDRLLDVVRAALPLLRPSAATPLPRAPSTTSRTLPMMALENTVRRVTQRIDMAAELGLTPSAGAEALDAALRIANLPVPRRGDLEEIPFARLLGQLYAARATGALMLRKSQVKKIVYLRQGVPIFVKSNLLGECLGHIMVRERLISAAQCERSVDRLKVEKRPQGQILIDMGAISPHNLEFALERQLELKLYDLFSWLEGKYLFNDKDEHTGSAVALSLSPAEMVFEGVRRTMSAERVRKELSRIEDRIPLPASDPTFRYQALELNPRAERLLDAIDGKKRLSELLARELLPGEQAAVLLYALVSTSLLRLLDAPALGARRDPADGLRASRPPPPPAPEEVMTLGEGDVEVLDTGEVPVEALAREDPALRAVAEARAKARQARDQVLRPPPIPGDDELPDPSYPGADVTRPSDPQELFHSAMLSTLSPLDVIDGPAAGLHAPEEPGEALTRGLRDDTLVGSGPRATAIAFAATSTPAAAPALVPPPVSLSPALAPTSLSPPAASLTPPPPPPRPQDAALALRGTAGVPDHVPDGDTGLSAAVDATGAVPATIAEPHPAEVAREISAVTRLADSADLAPIDADVEAREVVEVEAQASLDVTEAVTALPELAQASRHDIRARLEASLTAQLAARSPLAAEAPARGAPLAADLALPEQVVAPPAPSPERGSKPPSTPPPPPSGSPLAVPASTGRALRLDLEGDKQRRLDDLTTLHDLLSSQDLYTRLGLDADADADTITAAFEAKARAHHPDRAVPGSASRDLRAMAERVYLSFTRARDTLLHPAERRAYDRARAPQDEPHRVEAHATQAEGLFRRGMEHLDAGELAAAYEAFADAIALAPDEGTFLAYLAWTSFMLAPDDREVADRALAELSSATDKSPRAEEPHVFAGLIQEKLGRREDAARSLRRALVANPDSVRALRALRALAPPPEKKTGLFSLFGS